MAAWTQSETEAAARRLRNLGYHGEEVLRNGRVGDDCVVRAWTPYVVKDGQIWENYKKYFGSHEEIDKYERDGPYPGRSPLSAAEIRELRDVGGVIGVFQGGGFPEGIKPPPGVR
jgi:hypothetical protein